MRSGHTQSCGCLKSVGESKISNLLKENNISFNKEYVFPNFKFKNSIGIPRFDFYVENSYVIEFDGKAHYETNGGWNNEDNLKTIQLHDKEKNEFCKNNNIPLIRIPYYHFKELEIKDLIPSSSKFLLKGENE